MTQEIHRYRPPEDDTLERLDRERKPGEIESGMLTGSDDSDISATERFQGEVSRAEALAVLDPGHAPARGYSEEEPDELVQPLGHHLPGEA